MTDKKAVARDTPIGTAPVRIRGDWIRLKPKEEYSRLLLGRLLLESAKNVLRDVAGMRSDQWYLQDAVDHASWFIRDLESTYNVIEATDKTVEALQALNTMMDSWR